MNIPNLIKRIIWFDLDAYFLFTEPDRQFISSISPPSNGELVELDEVEEGVTKLLAFRPDQIKGLLYKRYQSGDRCFAFNNESGVKGYFWVGFGCSPKLDEFASCLKKEANPILLYDAYVDSSMRGRKIHPNLMAFSVKQVDPELRKNWFSFVGVKNLSALKNSRKFFKRHKLVYHVTFDVIGFKFNFYPKFQREDWHET